MMFKVKKTLGASMGWFSMLELSNRYPWIREQQILTEIRLWQPMRRVIGDAALAAMEDT